MGLRSPALTVVGVVVTTIARAISEWTPGGLSPRNRPRGCGAL